MSILHLNQIAGRPTVSVVTPEGLPATMWLGDFFKAHFDKIVAEGDGWPDDAQFKVEYRYHTWPMGWDKERYTDFFASREELDKWLADKADWSRSEDNQFEVSIWEWDLGVSYLESRHFG